MYCELLGIFTVVISLEGKRRLFNAQVFTERLSKAFSSFPSLPGRNKTVALSGEAVVAGAGSILAAGAAQVAGANASVEERLAVVEANVAALRQEQAKVNDQLRNQREMIGAAINAEAAARQRGMEDLGSRVKELSTGNLHIEMTGVWLLVLGTVLLRIT